MIEYHLNPVTPEKAEKEVLLEAKETLFQPGVQLRFIGAILLTAFVLILPLFLLSWLFPLMVAFEILITFPMIYGLFWMARKAVSGETVSIRDVFHAFSNRYGRSLATISVGMIWLFLSALIPILSVCGVMTLHTVVLSIPETAPYAFTLFIPYGIMIFLSVIAAFYLAIPGYFLVSIRVKNLTISLFRAMILSVSLLKTDLWYYFKMRMQLLLLNLISVCSVCALFPIYTIPLILVSNARYLDRLFENAMKRSDIDNKYSLL